MICPLCGKKHTDDSEKETTEKPNICHDCLKNSHKTMIIQCVIECGPNGITKHDGVCLIDQLTKLFISRGLAPIDIDFLEQYNWMIIPESNVKELQEAGILHK